jgi:CRISPR-associated endonuclease/helicase Cas3
MRKTDAKRRANKLVKTCSEDKQPQKTVYLSCKDTDGITELLREKLVCGGAAAVIVNTVKRAQRIAEALRQVFGADVFLLHSRFADSGRIKREQYLMDKIGKHASLKPDERFIVVGTQVIEQSLDIDFDFMITDICPIDLLLQRMGRLHRHNRSRRALLEKPQCAVLTDDEAYEKSAYVYAEYLLRKTGALLDEYKTVDLPRDIPIMVNAVYSDEEDSTDFADLRQEWLQKIAEKQGKAHAFLLGELKDSRFDARNNLKHWLDFSQSNSDAAGEASVRDGGRSLEIILIREQPEGYYTVGGAFLSGKGEPTEETCRIAARESLRLPQSLSNGKTLEELERRTLSQFSRWLASPWLAGQLILALPPEGAELSGFHIDYNTETGFTYERNHSTGV